MQIRVSRPCVLVCLQLATAVAALLLPALAPTPYQKVLLVPVAPGAADGVVPAILGNGGRMVDRGPVLNSIAAAGLSASVYWQLLSRGILVVAAPGAGCNGAESV